MEKEYISNQIAVYKTNKKLLEFKDKLQFGNPLKYAHIHSFGEKDINGRNIVSNIGVLIQDYSNGTGDKMIKAEVNVSPEDIQFIFNRLCIGQVDFEFNQEKISPKVEADGKSFVSKIIVKRAEKGPDGVVRKYPWYVLIENGKGIAVKGDSGGTYIKPKSYTSDKKIYININDRDLFKLLKRVNSYIDVWEKLYGSHLINQMLETKEALQNPAWM